MALIDNLVEFFKKPEIDTRAQAPRGVCPMCWGYQEYDKKIRKLYKDKQVDVNNHKDSFMLIQEFIVRNIDGIKLKEVEISSCPNCGSEFE